MTRKQELLKRVERLETLTARLEQTVRDIWASCSCLRKELDDFPDLPEDDTIYCYGPEEEEPEEPEEEDHD